MGWERGLCLVDDAEELCVSVFVGGNVVFPLAEQYVETDEGGDIGLRGVDKLEIGVEDAAVEVVAVDNGLTLIAVCHAATACLEDGAVQQEVGRQRDVFPDAATLGDETVGPGVEDLRKTAV